MRNKDFGCGFWEIRISDVQLRKILKNIIELQGFFEKNKDFLKKLEIFELQGFFEKNMNFF